ncbi:putative bifunctional SAT/APS kinase 2, related [Neospora caninum Liverpool]|uniref:Probable bifunctional SAT/APS kinase 2, related n=1 Tax=Neospora caninum (strain Liverpool) TaxID=572307 RepID=F0VFV1_NEOCL|nr:putative bifunctional SAT/APS kinase 2, related [Neospora caninum Liverpool]CBZ52595.1 putative bifunctional SAT/APS kinase 2, related [Neospora caninum Liverpool]CEL66573.1 TPA: Probable bifunctional SAT/APS kinase 2, related [Neospora caninum Liverpool]|eukprot:XP_003882627.1 putative bifunctional SAT/APS kinase 2, related [Neospora caninum Liverpool]
MADNTSSSTPTLLSSSGCSAVSGTYKGMSPDPAEKTTGPTLGYGATCHFTAPAASLDLPTDWTLNERQLCEVELIVSGAMAPLNGFMDERSYRSVCTEMRLPTGEIFPIPIVLAIPKSASKPNVHWLQQHSECDKDSSDCPAAQGAVIKLRNNVGTVIAELKVASVFEPNLQWEQELVLGTTDTNHPYVEYMNTNYKDCVYVGGDLVPKAPIEHFDYERYRLSPAHAKAEIKKRNWEAVVGFQTRNPMHRSHYELTKFALAKVQAELSKQPHLLLTPAVGPTQPGDVPYPVRVRCYEKILKYYGEDEVMMALIPIPMRMAGPRECVWHALIRKNFGCTHFIVGRDHAGPSTLTKDGKKFYDPYEAHRLLATVAADLGIVPVFGHEMVYLGEGKGYCSANAVTEEEKGFMKTISGTQLRRLLEERKNIPTWFSFPEVVDELRKFYKPNYQRGLCIYFTGLPCSGKSTLAQALEAVLSEREEETRRITLLDADVVRQHLSRGLGFSREDRSTNVRRIGYIASEIAKHGGICLVANIAPYAVDRDFNRNLITSTGGQYIEVYVSTPLSVCEQRDVKELYKKARQGIIKQFTGISDPYEPPRNAEVVIDSSSNLKEKIGMIVKFLTEKEFVLPRGMPA